MEADHASDVAAMITGLWQKILRREDFGTEDNFFLLGGDSMSAAMLIQQLWEEAHLKLTLLDLYEHASLKDLQVFVTQQLETDQLNN